MRLSPSLRTQAPVVGGRGHAQTEERQTGEGEQGVAGRDGGVDDQGLGDVRQDVAQQDPYASRAQCACRRHVVQRFHTRDQGLHQTREPRRHGQSDRENGPPLARPEDHREEQRQQQSGEGHRDADERVHHPADPSAEQYRHAAEQQARAHPDRRGAQGESHRQPRRHQHPRQHVAAQTVGTEPVVRRGTGQQVRAVHGIGPLTPQHRGEDRQQGDDGQQRGGGGTHRGLHDGEPPGP
ncbi:hypothetical protein QFZ75_007656 [Streptomyces sp. V3I8]|nr:hypothetical protein [Streptomyces sp. V3I8]